MSAANRPQETAETEQTTADGGELSSGPSGFDGTETAAGGADAVPDTPDIVEEDYAE